MQKATSNKAIRQAISPRGAAAAGDPDLEAHVQLAFARWPQIDPEVERIVSRVARAARYLDKAAQRGLSRVGLTQEEYKVICVLAGGERSHGSLCRELGVSTGAMTNRLDKLERTCLLKRRRDPQDRRGILVALTRAGRRKLDEYITTGSNRERELLSTLRTTEKRQLNRLLQKLLISLHTDLDT